jgi:DNA-binding PadR family transcriptional regulator
VRTAILLVLADEPMHGYQIMQAISDRTGGAWRPSPGAVYPTIAQLEDEGLVTTQEEGGRRLVTLTSEGRTYVEERSAQRGDPFAGFADRPAGPDLRDPLRELHTAARQIASSGSVAQVEAAAQVLAGARRSLYLILAGEVEDTGE